jgi:hypothetical protein
MARFPRRGGGGWGGRREREDRDAGAMPDGSSFKKGRCKRPGENEEKNSHARNLKCENAH